MSNLIKLLSNLHKTNSAEPGTLAPDLALLRAWQSHRLERTYADLLADGQFAPTCRFFLDEIYGPRDFSQRDHDAEHLHDLLSRVLPEVMLVVLAKTIQLNRLTSQLDQELIRVLVEQLGVTTEITPGLYAEAYRLCDNLAERRAQIVLLVEILAEVCEVSKSHMTGIALRMARIPAYTAGWQDLFDFLDRGYQAASRMRDIKRFVGTIQSRESTILERIFADDPAPFAPYLSEE